MPSPWIRSALEKTLRLTIRRKYGSELSLQRRLRARDESETRQYSLRAAVAYANTMRHTSPGFAKRLLHEGLGQSITAETWSSLPVLTKSDYRNDSNSWYGEPVRSGSVVWKYTSGSTGEPFKFPHTDESQISESAANELNLLDVGWSPAMGRATIKFEPKPSTGMRKLYRALIGRREISFAAPDFRLAHVPQMVEQLQLARVSYLRGYSTTVYLFAQEILRQQLSCPINLITTFGEGLFPHQANVVEQAFDGKVYRDYGGSEAMHIGFECKEQDGYHVDLSRFHVEILKDGKPAGANKAGDLVITAFRNTAMPLVRYRIGDIGRWAVTGARCPCGNRFPQLAQIEGRAADIVVTPSGRVINVPLLVVVFEYAQEHIVEFKVIQKEGCHFDILWVARHNRAADYLPSLHQKLVATCGDECTFDWHQVEEINADSTGKHRILVLSQ